MNTTESEKNFVNKLALLDPTIDTCQLCLTGPATHELRLLGFVRKFVHKFVQGLVRKCFLPSPPPPLSFLFWLSPQLHAGKILFRFCSLVFLCSPTPRKRLLCRVHLAQKSCQDRRAVNSTSFLAEYFANITKTPTTSKVCHSLPFSLKLFLLHTLQSRAILSRQYATTSTKCTYKIT